MGNTSQAEFKFESVTPRLPVANIDQALAFYVDRLGFELGWKWGDPVTHASVCRDGVGLDLLTGTFGGSAPVMLYIQLRGVDAYCQELRARQVPMSDLQDKPYGMRDFEVIDPDGNRIAFGEPTDK